VHTTDRGSEPRTVYDRSRGPAWVTGTGGVAMKFLVRWRHDRPVADGGPDLAQEAFEAVRDVVEDCRAHGVPSVVEPLVQTLPGETLSATEKEALVVESARRLATLKPDLLKLEWPGGPEACAEVTEALTVDGRRVPWALLSAGVPFEAFTERVRVALDAGARGFIAGRAIWGEAVTMPPPERRAFLAEVARPRLAALVQLLDEHAARGSGPVASGTTGGQ
jgi:tagatose 1,6-diphosphate aldolase/sulfofructosephosphate aldolase